MANIISTPEEKVRARVSKYAKKATRKQAKSAPKSKSIRAPLHPGEVLREEFLIPLDMSAGALAKACGVPRTRIERLANEETGITADTALRLSKAFGTTAALWLNLQNDYDVRMATREIGRALDKIPLVIEKAA